MNLDRNQEKAVRHGKGPALVLAGPGSGKTAVITERTRKLIEQDQVPADRILVITFSRKAAEEMERRFLRMYRGNGRPCFGTFHSVFFRILKSVYRIDNTTLLSEDDKKYILTAICKHYFNEYDDTEDSYRSFSRQISLIKSGSGHIENYLPSGVDSQTFRKIFYSYQQELRKRGKIDFDDMILLCLKLLQERADVREFFQQQFQYILVDEYQDISPSQYEIINLLAEPENNLFVVGDDDQSIYAFRGAKPGLMKTFLKDHQKASVITLQMNYRCAPSVLSAAQTVIRHNKDRFVKNQISSKKQKSGTFTLCRCKDPYSEYQEMAFDINQKLARGVSPSCIAVLVRNRLQLSSLLQILQKNRIPYCLAEDASLKNRPSGGIFVLTMHASKGLEFDHVFLPDLNEGTLPGKRSVKREEIEEERRLFYVAMTRAAETLTIYYCETRRQKSIEPSRFLEGLV